MHNEESVPTLWAPYCRVMSLRVRSIGLQPDPRAVRSWVSLSETTPNHWLDPVGDDTTQAGKYMYVMAIKRRKVICNENDVEVDDCEGPL